MERRFAQNDLELSEIGYRFEQLATHVMVQGRPLSDDAGTSAFGNSHLTIGKSRKAIQQSLGPEADWQRRTSDLQKRTSIREHRCELT